MHPEEAFREVTRDSFTTTFLSVWETGTNWLDSSIPLKRTTNCAGKYQQYSTDINHPYWE